MAENIPFKQRPFDVFLAMVFAVFAVTTAMADFMPTLGVELTADSPNPLVRMNYAAKRGGARVSRASTPSSLLALREVA